MAVRALVDPALHHVGTARTAIVVGEAAYQSRPVQLGLLLSGLLAVVISGAEQRRQTEISTVSHSDTHMTSCHHRRCVNVMSCLKVRGLGAAQCSGNQSVTVVLDLHGIY